jgi:hypothetical protein
MKTIKIQHFKTSSRTWYKIPLSILKHSDFDASRLNVGCRTSDTHIFMVGDSFDIFKDHMKLKNIEFDVGIGRKISFSVIEDMKHFYHESQEKRGVAVPRTLTVSYSSTATNFPRWTTY